MHLRALPVPDGLVIGWEVGEVVAEEGGCRYLQDQEVRHPLDAHVFRHLGHGDEGRLVRADRDRDDAVECVQFRIGHRRVLAVEHDASHVDADFAHKGADLEQGEPRFATLFQPTLVVRRSARAPLRVRSVVDGAAARSCHAFDEVVHVLRVVGTKFRRDFGEDATALEASEAEDRSEVHSCEAHAKEHTHGVPVRHAFVAGFRADLLDGQPVAIEHVGHVCGAGPH
jgi:hypothetical protein